VAAATQVALFTVGLRVGLDLPRGHPVTPVWSDCSSHPVFQRRADFRCRARYRFLRELEHHFPFAATASLAGMGTDQTIGAEAGIAIGIAVTIGIGAIADGVPTGMRPVTSIRIPM